MLARRLALLILLVWAALAPAEARFSFSHGAPSVSPVSAGQTIASVALSNNSFVAGSTSGTVVGAFSTTMSAGPPFTGSYSLSGTDAASFTLSGSSLQTSGVLCGSSPPCTYHINGVATQSGISNSPFTQAETITANAPVFASLTLNGTCCTGSFTASTPNAVIGTVAALLSTGTANPTYAIVSSGSDHSGTTCTSTNGANFQIVSSTTLETNGTGLAAGSYPGVCVSATQAGVTYVQAFTLTGNTPGTIALTRSFVQPTGTSTPSLAFWQIGQPFKSAAQNGGTAEVPSGQYLAATMSGAVSPGGTVRVQECDAGGPLLHADGSYRWARILVDYSGQTITPGSSATLQFTTTSTPPSGTANRTFADIATANGGYDTVTLNNVGYVQASFKGSISGTTLTNSGVGQATPGAAGAIAVGQIIGDNNGLVAAGTTVTASLGSNQWTVSISQTVAAEAMYGTAAVSGYSLPSGPWTATFDGGATNNVVQICNTPMGLYVKDWAHFENGGTQNAILWARMDYWITQTASGTLGPIRSEGPFIENEFAFTPGIAMVYADITFYRPGGNTGSCACLRQQINIPISPMTGAAMPRIDGQPDVEYGGVTPAMDPAVVAEADYTLLRHTRTIPPYPSGISYVGGTSAGNGPGVPVQTISSISGSTFTAPSNTQGVYNSSYLTPNYVVFSGSAGGTNIVLGQGYWLCPITSTTFKLYDTEPHAIGSWVIGSGCGGTVGVITPTGTYTGGLSVAAAVGPEAGGSWITYTGAGGTAPDLSWDSEWGAAYILGNTNPQFQMQGRAQAFALMSQPLWVENTTSGSATYAIPSLGDSATTPSTGTNSAGGTGLGTALTHTCWSGIGSSSCFSSNINGGTPPPGGSPIWYIENSHQPGLATYPVWLLTGDPYLQDLLLQQGNSSIAAENWSGNATRNPQVAGTGTTYSAIVIGNSTCYGGATRVCAWNWRNVSDATYAAPQGSAEQTYFRNVMSNNVAFFTAYAAFEGTNFQNLGISNDDDVAGNGPVGTTYISGYMQHYYGMSVGMSGVMNGEFISGLSALYNPQWIIGATNGGCPYWWSGYTFGAQLSDWNTSAPTQMIPTPTQLAPTNYGGDGLFSYAASTGIITVTGALGSTWVGPDGQTFSVAVGDLLRPSNMNQDASNANAAPSPLVDNQYYCVVQVIDAADFRVATSGPSLTNCTSGAGSTITSFASSVTGGGGWMLPNGQSCPTYTPAYNNPDGRLSFSLMDLGIAAAQGVTGASAAFNSALAETTGYPGFFDTEAAFAGGNSW